MCATKEQKDHTFPKLNRNKYMVTDSAAYIGRCRGCRASWGTRQANSGPTMVFHAPRALEETGREGQTPLELNISSRAWFKYEDIIEDVFNKCFLSPTCFVLWLRT